MLLVIFPFDLPDSWCLRGCVPLLELEAMSGPEDTSPVARGGENLVGGRRFD